MESRYLFGEGKTGRGEIPLPASSSLETRRSRKPRVAFLCCFLGLLAWIRLCQRHQPPDSWAVTQQSRNPAYLIEAEHGAVASENKRCSDMGVEVLKDGGNAIDAAVSVTFCVGVVNMFSSGIGGGGFMTVRIPSKDANSSSEVFDIDFREVAPALSNSSMFSGGSNSSMFGGLSVAVPGELRGLEEAHKRWGTVPWKRLVQPSVDLAAGWQVDKELGRRIPWFVDLMLGNPDWRDIFAPNGVLLKEGEMIRRTNYSRTLATIATGGADAFYKGPIADALVQKITMTGGILSHADLEGYKVKVSRALQGTYRDRKIHTTHAPTSGPVLLHMLNLMEKYDLETRDGVNTHRSVEAMKFGFSARTRICDPGFQNITDIINSISTKTFANIIFPNITDGHTHPPDYYNPKYDVLTDHGTSHTSIVDKNGMAVSLTSTINLVFGSEVLDPVTGVILNDEMDDFSVPGTPNGFGLWPSPYNYPEPGKRPLSSTTPTIIENADGSFYLSIGGSGGSRIFPAVFQVILNLEWGLDLSSAIEFGRLHNQLYPLFLDADNVYPSDILDDLRRRGHNVIVADVNRVASAVNGVMIKDGKIFAASDSRKNGIAAGY
ncbi:gamma-glutamyltranspeptidase [Guyanagaster necrorhizus]|uniref:Glutathione hydrolase n=1 Tax=Guyanagaster necrorhizus TaxID=856835 RepID=A0A9P7VZ08_9AGAR|nr:gamma-glutamyltranspeptidase [Guyanagaster necrorhizus MCA 3950]KAG7449552.1 gamma-glutamyltranspeptidase [Guyanagaster necrorhizus MCA 3950]